MNLTHAEKSKATEHQRRIIAPSAAQADAGVAQPGAVTVFAPTRGSHHLAKPAQCAYCHREAARFVELELFFSISRDEEYVHLSLQSGRVVVDLGARSHHYLLLTLARQRLRDAHDGVPENDCGWVDLHDWEHDPTMAPPLLNLHVHRIRRQFLAHDVNPGFDIVERQVRHKKIRLRACYFQIHPL
jgi:hypothetical protein